VWSRNDMETLRLKAVDLIDSVVAQHTVDDGLDLSGLLKICLEKAEADKATATPAAPAPAAVPAVAEPPPAASPVSTEEPARPLQRQNSALASKISAKLDKQPSSKSTGDKAPEVSDAAANPPTPPPAAPAAPPAGRQHTESVSARGGKPGGPAEMEAEARAWVEAITGEALEGTLHEALKSGVMLCKLVDKLQPGCCKAPSKMAAPFKQMENIGNYLGACTKLGQRQMESFQTVDLYENQNMNAVVIQLHSLGRIAQAIGFDGPKLGIKVVEKNERTFTEAQLNEAKGATTFLGKGSHGTVGGEMSKAHVGKQYDRGAFSRGEEGLGTGGEMGLVGKGAYEVGKGA